MASSFPTLLLIPTHRILRTTLVYSEQALRFVANRSAPFLISSLALWLVLVDTDAALSVEESTASNKPTSQVVQDIDFGRQIRPMMPRCWRR